VQQLAPEFGRGETIVALSADFGDKYLDTIYDPIWVANVIAADDNKSAHSAGILRRHPDAALSRIPDESCTSARPRKSGRILARSS